MEQVRHVSRPPGGKRGGPRALACPATSVGLKILVKKTAKEPKGYPLVIPRSLKRQTTCAILRTRHVGHIREPREPDEGSVDARGRHEPKGSKWEKPGVYHVVLDI